MMIGYINNGMTDTFCRPCFESLSSSPNQKTWLYPLLFNNMLMSWVFVCRLRFVPSVYFLTKKWLSFFLLKFNLNSNDNDPQHVLTLAVAICNRGTSQQSAIFMLFNLSPSGFTDIYMTFRKIRLCLGIRTLINPPPFVPKINTQAR